MSNILQLPLYRISTGVGVDEDWTNLSFIFTLSDGVTPLSLVGITFALDLSPRPTGFTPLPGQVSGSSNNLLTFFIQAAQKSSWSGIFEVLILATDTNVSPTEYRDLLANSSLSIGEPQVLSIRRYVADGDLPATLMSPVSAAVADAIADAAKLVAPAAREFSITSNATVAGPGIYLMSAQSITLTLPTSWGSSHGVIIKDVTGLNNPNQTISGLIDGASPSDPIVFKSAYQAISLIWSPTLSKWLIYA